MSENRSRKVTPLPGTGFAALFGGFGTAFLWMTEAPLIAKALPTAGILLSGLIMAVEVLRD